MMVPRPKLVDSEPGRGKIAASPALARIKDQLWDGDASRPQPGEAVAVALSGGLDSMVAALLLRERGHPLVGLHMLLGSDSPRGAGEDVRHLAARLSIRLEEVDLRRPFFELVITPFLQAYRRGRTPNPCVLCNPTVKFALLQKEAARLGARWLATGHYARVQGDPLSGPLRLLRARDRRKDQSYFLYGLSQAQLRLALFPLGNLLKSQVRQIAAAAGISDWHCPDSQEICFIPDSDYRRFLERHLGRDLPESGPVVDLQGRLLGKHGGIHRFTIGQRRGLGISSAEPYYVIGMEPETNTVRIGRQRDLYRREMLVGRINWVDPSPPSLPLSALVQVRSRHRQAAALLEPACRGVLVRFRQPQMAIAPGQAAVFYCGDQVLGGGIIEQVIE